MGLHGFLGRLRTNKMADETFVIVEMKCGNCKTKFDVERWESDDDTVVLECPNCKYLVNWDGTIFAEVV